MSEPRRKQGRSLGFSISIAGLIIGYWLAVWGDGAVFSAATLIGAAIGAIVGLVVGISLEL